MFLNVFLGTGIWQINSCIYYYVFSWFFFVCFTFHEHINCVKHLTKTCQIFAAHLRLI